MYWIRFLSCFTLLSSVVLGFATFAAVPNSASELTALQKLLQRWLGLHKVHLIPEKLPKQLPVNLPLPQKAKVVGTVVNSPNRFEIILDVVQSPEQVQAFYQQKLLNTGWQKQKQQDLSTQKPGFLDSISAVDDTSNKNEDITFCSASNKAKLNVQASYLFISTTELRPQARLKLEVSPSNSSSNFQCSLKESIRKTQLPSLNPPSHVGINGILTSTSQQTASSYAVLNTKIDAQMLAAHYAAQIEKFGWQRNDSKHNKLNSWITWTFKDKQNLPKQGLLSITQITGATNQYVAYIEYR